MFLIYYPLIHGQPASYQLFTLKYTKSKYLSYNTNYISKKYNLETTFGGDRMLLNVTIKRNTIWIKTNLLTVKVSFK